MCCGCGKRAWRGKDIYSRYFYEVRDERKGRTICTDTIKIWSRVYRVRLGKWDDVQRPLAYMWFSLSRATDCTCGTCAGWRGV